MTPLPGSAQVSELLMPASTAEAEPEMGGAGECPLQATTSPAERLDVQLEYILWWLREGRVPPLLTTSSPASAGILGRSDTRVLYGDDRLTTRHGDRFNGLRVYLGYWLDDDHTLGVEGRAFFLERDSTYFKAISDGSQVLARPFINVLDGSPASEVIAGPSQFGPRDGQFVGYSRVELFGEEANFKTPLCTSEFGRVELLIGARFLQMRDRVDLTATGHPLASLSTLLGLTDHIRVEDHFYGGNLGLRGEWTDGRWGLCLTGEVALGVTDAPVRAFGDQLFQTPAQRVTVPNGLLVQPSNSGNFAHSEFDVVSQISLNASCRLSNRVTIFLGYTFLYWANPLRAGDQLDLEVNPTLATGSPHGPPRPVLPFRTDNFWAQGVNAGLQLSW
jgi:hypothetical protein